MVSSSTMTAPRSARRPATVDFPDPIPPVRPTSNTPSSDLGSGRRFGRPDGVGLEGLGQLGPDLAGGGCTAGLLEVLGPGRLRLGLGHELGVVRRADVVA